MILTIFGLLGAAVLGYLVGYGKGWTAAFKFLAQFAPEQQDDEWAEAQREQAWLQ